jgi:hypothetical protein
VAITPKNFTCYTGPVWSLRSASALALGACLSCAAQRVGGNPQSVLHAYASALINGQADAAYALLSDDARRSMSLQAFRRLVTDDPDAAIEIGRALDRPTTAAVVTATIVSASGQELHLVLENGAWRVDGSSIDLYAQDTPRHAIQGFVRAVEHKRYDIVMRYVPDAHKDGLDEGKLREAWEGRDKEEMAQVIGALKRALPASNIEQTGQRAAMAYGTGTMQLVRERGLWKIENFD